jgi:tetratricopeptide (TPR) repeat protein
MLLRTPQGQSLGSDAKASLARALGLLGAAYSQREEFPSAEEVLRLGVQWVQDGEVAGELFAQLGEIAVRQGQHGQAIGLLRRALSLGGPKGRVLPLLAECFLDRGRAVAALVCLDRALEAGVDEAELAEARERALSQVGSAYDAYCSYLAS